MKNINFTSTAFTNGGTIPVKHTCDGENLSPALEWGELPAGTRSLALIVEDPDAPTGDFVHWVVYGLPPTMKGLAEGLPTVDRPDKAVAFGQGRNDFGRTGYRGPAPPPGRVHHYLFRLRALDQPLNLGPKADKAAVREAVQGHVLGEAILTGTYRR